jgi:hypothetical protein
MKKTPYKKEQKTNQLINKIKQRYNNKNLVNIQETELEKEIQILQESLNNAKKELTWIKAMK